MGEGQEGRAAWRKSRMARAQTSPTELRWRRAVGGEEAFRRFHPAFLWQTRGNFEHRLPKRCPFGGLDFPKIKRDRIDIRGLGLVSHIGVPEDERAVPQRLEADVTLWPAAPLSGLGEDIDRTINYYEVALACRDEALRCERKLIETLAEDFCRLLLQRWPLAMVRVRLHKFILPDTQAVSVTLTRQPADFAAATS